MTITIELPPDVEQRVVENARLRGVPVSEYAGQLIAEAVPSSAAWRQSKVTPQEFRNAMEDLSKIAPRKLPLLSDEALRRENMYEREDAML